MTVAAEYQILAPPQRGLMGRVALLGGIGLLSLGILNAPGEGVERLKFLTAGLCALQADRQVVLGGMMLPLCFRNTGIYLGVACSLTYLSVVRRGRWAWPRPLALALLAAFVLAMGVDGVNSLIGDVHGPTLYPPHNMLRLGTGLLAGVSLGVLVLGLTRLMVAIPESRVPGSGAAPLRAADVAVVLAMATPGAAAIALEAGVFAFPIGIVSTLGVVAAVACVNRWLLELTVTVRSLSSPDLRWLLAVLLALTELAVLSTLRMMVSPIP